MKRKTMMFSLLVAGCVCAITNVGATSFSVTDIAATSGTLNKVGTKSSDDKYWNANFARDGKTNTIILYMYSNPSSSVLGNNIIAVEGGGTVQQSAWGNAGQSVKVVWRDYNGNWASYTCTGRVDIR